MIYADTPAALPTSIWGLLGVVVTTAGAVLVPYLAGRRAQSSDRSTQVVQVPTPEGAPPMPVDVSGLPSELAAVIRTMASTIEDMQDRLSEQSRHLDRLQAQAAEHVLVVAAFGQIVTWLDNGANPPPPVVSSYIRALLFPPPPEGDHP